MYFVVDEMYAHAHDQTAAMTRLDCRLFAHSFPANHGCLLCRDCRSATTAHVVLSNVEGRTCRRGRTPPRPDHCSSHVTTTHIPRGSTWAASDLSLPLLQHDPANNQAIADLSCAAQRVTRGDTSQTRWLTTSDPFTSTGAKPLYRWRTTEIRPTPVTSS